MPPGGTAAVCWDRKAARLRGAIVQVRQRRQRHCPRQRTTRLRRRALQADELLQTKLPVCAHRRSHCRAVLARCAKVVWHRDALAVDSLVDVEAALAKAAGLLELAVVLLRQQPLVPARAAWGVKTTLWLQAWRISVCQA